MEISGAAPGRVLRGSCGSRRHQRVSQNLVVRDRCMWYRHHGICGRSRHERSNYARQTL